MRTDFPPVLLASASPRRTQILRQAGIAHRVWVPDVFELDEGDPVEVAVVNACRKASAAREQAREEEAILAVDTVVTIDGGVFGKARDSEHARQMLRTLRGRTHTVVGGVAWIGPGPERVASGFDVRTQVSFRSFGDDELERYVAGGEWNDRAGAYAIQGEGAALVAGIEGDYFNVVGLPLASLVEHVRSSRQG